MHSFNQESIQHLLLARYHVLWFTEVGAINTWPLLCRSLQCVEAMGGSWVVSSGVSKGQGLEEDKVSALRFPETVRFEALEGWVEFWQMEAERGGNGTDRHRKVGKFKMYWRKFDYSRSVVERKTGQWEGADFSKTLNAHLKYTNFNLWAMRTGLVSDFSHSLSILTGTKGYA